MRKLLLGAATLVTSLGLTASVATAAHLDGSGAGSIRDTGPDSTATIRTRIKDRTDIENKNKINVTNDTKQTAWSGDARVEDNNRGGDARTGDARNKNTFDASVKVDNNSAGILRAAGNNHDGGAGGGSISDTGPHSDARISTKISDTTKVENKNDINIHNNTYQEAYSGDATVSNNTRGGDARTGDASNSNNTSVNVHVSN